MDELARRLREDAARINVDISPELEDRIRASLENVSPEAAPRPEPPRRPPSMWLFSSLTGVAMAAIVIVVINLASPDADDASKPPAAAGASNGATQAVPPETLDLRARAAILTDPLEEELANLESDLRKAEEAVRNDLDLIL